MSFTIYVSKARNPVRNQEVNDLRKIRNNAHLKHQGMRFRETQQ